MLQSTSLHIPQVNSAPSSVIREHEMRLNALAPSKKFYNADIKRRRGGMAVMPLIDTYVSYVDNGRVHSTHTHSLRFYRELVPLKPPELGARYVHMESSFVTERNDTAAPPPCLFYEVRLLSPTKGASINDVHENFKFFDPPPCHIHEHTTYQYSCPPFDYPLPPRARTSLMEAP